MRKTGRISRYSVRKADWRDGLLGIKWCQSTGISPEGTRAVRFQRTYRANATRSQADEVAKVT